MITFDLNSEDINHRTNFLGFSLIYLPYIFLGQEPKFKH